MQDYEVRLYRADGALSVIMKISANGRLDAQAQASAMLKGDIVRAEIWREHQHVETMETTTKVTSKYAPRSLTRPQGGAGSNR